MCASGAMADPSTSTGPPGANQEPSEQSWQSFLSRITHESYTGSSGTDTTLQATEHAFNATLIKDGQAHQLAEPQGEPAPQPDPICGPVAPQGRPESTNTTPAAQRKQTKSNHYLRLFTALAFAWSSTAIHNSDCHAGRRVGCTQHSSPEEVHAQGKPSRAVCSKEHRNTAKCARRAICEQPL